MYHVPFQWMICLYLTACVFVVAIVWFVDDRLRRARERRALRFRLRCRRCALEWEERSGESLLKCPRCGSVNERERLESI